MLIHLTLPEMLSRWRLHRGVLPVTSGPALTATVNPALDDLHKAQIEEWYSRLLLTAPEEMIDPADYASRTILPPASDGGVTLSLPREAVRLLRVRLRGWLADARIIDSPHDPEAIRQLHPYTRATADSPVAVARPGGFVTLYPAMPDNVLETLTCAVRTTDGRYHFDEAALISNQ